MFIDIRVSPAFYEPINQDPDRETMRHQVLNIHKNGTAPLEHIFNQMKCAGLTMLGLHPIDYTSEIGCPVVTNEEIRALTDMEPERFIGFASVDPLDPEAPDKLEDAFSRLKLKGLSLHSGRLKYMPDDACMEPLYEICERFKKPVMFHAGLSWEPDCQMKYSQPVNFEEVAIKYPELRFCLAHFGWPWIHETTALVLKYANVYTDTAMLYMDSPEIFLREVLTEQLGHLWIEHNIQDKVMFGSNNPRFRTARIKRGLESLDWKPLTKEKVLGGNALKFLGLEA